MNIEMRCTIKYCFSFIFLFGIFSTSIASSPKADSLYRSGKYFEASIEYERLLFRERTQSNLNYFRYRKALCYKQMKQFDRVLSELQSIYFSDPEDTLYRLVSYQQSLCLYLSGEPAKALWKIDEYFHRSADSALFGIFMPVKIMALNETFQWDEARKCFLEFVARQHFSDEKEAELIQRVTTLYDRKNRPRIKSVSKAEDLSRFVPGLGQIYAGKAGEGVVNFLINASILTFAVYQVYQGFYITGYLAGLGFFNKTYHGGMKRAGDIAAQKNQELLVGFNRDINKLILTDFQLN